MQAPLFLHGDGLHDRKPGKKQLKELRNIRKEKLEQVGGKSHEKEDQNISHQATISFSRNRSLIVY